jgi:hypothetical protein
MGFLVAPIFCVSVGFVAFLGAGGLLSYFRLRNLRGSHSTRRERKAAKVIGVSVGLALAAGFGMGSALNSNSGAMVLTGVYCLILLVTVIWVWRILTARTAQR